MLPDFGPTMHLERALEPLPIGPRWAARSADGGASMVVALAPELVALAADRDRLVAALRARAGPSLAGDVGLLPILDVLVAADGRVALVLPLDERAPASDRLARGRTFSTTEVADATRALGRALGDAHAAGVRHGAVSPGMVFVGADAPPRAMGVGLAEAFVAAGAPRAEVAAALGARAYVAPEVAGSGGDLAGTAASLADMYALGATLYACLTGRPPFGGRTTAMMMAAVLADEALTGEVPLPRRDTREQAEATERLTQALLRAVERAPADRWPTMGEMVRALDPRTPTPPSPVAPVPHRTRRVPRAGCLPAIVLLTGVMSLIAVALLPR